MVSLGLVLLAGTAQAQPTYSIDFQGPTFGAGTILDGDILTPIPPGMAAPPAVVIPAGAAGLALTIAPHGGAEVDALSYGTEPVLTNNPGILQTWTHSVDEFAFGLPGVAAPSVTTEGAGGLMEASADIYLTPTPPGPFIPAVGGNVGVFDGNGGLTPFAAPGLNLVEPNAPTGFPGTLPDPGDNLDAWDINAPPAAPVYFSLDSAFGDPFEPAPANTGSAAAQGVPGPFVGGDVLISPLTGAAPALYADSRFLGLNGGTPTAAVNTVDIDDLDALVLWDNGDGVYQPTTGPYSWLGGGGVTPTDMLLYSVRRNSAILTVLGGTLDALGSGLVITEGDVLVPVRTTVPGVWAPGIFISAEALGLSTVRTTGGAGWGIVNPRSGGDKWDDDLDALDVQVVNIPEPASCMLMLVGLACLGLLRRRLRRA